MSKHSFTTSKDLLSQQDKEWDKLHHPYLQRRRVNRKPRKLRSAVRLLLSEQRRDNKKFIQAISKDD
jgi:hypothetical protein